MKTNEMTETLRACFADIWKNNGKMVDYNMRDIAAACKLSNGMILTDNKQRIEKNFCFGWSSCGQGPEFSEACRAERNATNGDGYFIRENMRWYEDRLRDLSSPEWYPLLVTAYYGQNETNPLRAICFRRLSELLTTNEFDDLKPGAMVKDDRGNPAYYPTADDIERIRAMYEEAKEKHEKKVRAYLKRYGTSKVRTWTYWLDD